MNTQPLPPKSDSPALYTPAVARQLALLECWWNGWSLQQMGDAQGITRARVAAILREVGCRAGRCPDQAQRHPDSRRPVPAPRIARARALLAHPKVARLTVRQRAAIAWTALGLSSRDIAKRMGVTGQRVRCLLVSSEARLQRHTPRPVSNEPPTDNTPMPALCWDGLEPLTGQTPENQETQNAN